MAYCVRADIEAQYGSENVAKWADLNSNEDAGEITARITQAILEADNEIDSRLRLGPYEIPFTDTIPTGIISLSAMYAGIWLYSSRGVIDYTPKGAAQDQLSYQRKEFDRRIRDILAGRYQPADMPSVHTTFPTIYEETS